MFIPTTKKEAALLGWDELDVILVTGDSYIDSPYIGVSVIGKVLMDAGYRVGMIAQPDTESDRDCSRLGEPALFWGITAGCMDSMIANYTATRKKRKKDDLTAGGKNIRRPDRATIVYGNLIRRYFKDTRPIIIGGIEASLRRISHYDYWSDKIRRSILFDSRADLLVYGMAERAIVQVATQLKRKESVKDIKGICYIAKEKREGYLELSPHDEVAGDKKKFRQMFYSFYNNNDPVTATGLCQRQDTRFLIHNPPQPPLSPQELDRVYEMDFERALHPGHLEQGPVRAIDTIRFSITTHRGCYGECNYCSITAHQGRTVTSRSEASIVREAEGMTRHPDFKGIISDIGGPTANMYGIECALKAKKGGCIDKRCLIPSACEHLPVNHLRQRRLLKKIREIHGVKKAFIGSGIRHDLILQDKKHGRLYLEDIIRHHISGQLKIAPEHSQDHILELMGKPASDLTKRFVSLFRDTTERLGMERYLTCYLIAAYPGCTLKDMYRLKDFTKKVLKFRPRQVQIFTPTPSTMATMIYFTETALSGKSPIFVEKDIRKKEKQKEALF